MATNLRFLFTVDADWIPGSEPGYEALLRIMAEFNLPGTFFVTGKFARDNPSLLRETSERGHEVGSHGWDHGLNWKEGYRHSSYEDQRRRLMLCTDTLEEILGARPRSFRAPNLSASDTMFRVLAELGYEVDSSVPARRYDCFLGQVNWTKYFFEPLNPYPVPCRLDGESREIELLEVPPSAFGLPVVMSTMRRAGLRTLLWLSRRVRKRSYVLNFYCHPWEFVEPERRPFPAEAPDRYMQDCGPHWLDPLRRFVEQVLDWGYEPHLLSDIAVRDR